MTNPWNVQVALVDLFAADDLLPPFYDALPNTARLPYGTYGSPTASRQVRLGPTRGTRNSIEINWWSMERENLDNGQVNLYGNRLVAQYAERAKELLRDPLILPEGVVLLLRWETDTFLPEPDRNVRRVRQMYTIDVR